MSSYSTCVPSLKFVCLFIRNIWRTSGLSISRPDHLDLWPWNWCASLPIGWATFLFSCFCDVYFSTYRPTPIRRITWPCNLDLWPWRSRRLSLMLVFVLRLCTKFELRRPSRSEDTAASLSVKLSFFLQFDEPGRLDRIYLVVRLVKY